MYIYIYICEYGPVLQLFLFIQDSDVPALALAANTGMSEEDIKQQALIYKKESV